MSAGWPYKCTGMIAFVRDVIARSRRDGSIVNDRGSTSTNTALAPVYWIAATVATNVNGTVITSSPGPTPAASNARWSAAVPELTATPWSAPHTAANSCSNASTSSPSTNWLVSSTRAIAASTSDLMLWYSARKSTNGTIRPSRERSKRNDERLRHLAGNARRCQRAVFVERLRREQRDERVIGNGQATASRLELVDRAVGARGAFEVQQAVARGARARHGVIEKEQPRLHRPSLGARAGQVVRQHAAAHQAHEAGDDRALVLGQEKQAMRSGRAVQRDQMLARLQRNAGVFAVAAIDLPDDVELALRRDRTHRHAQRGGAAHVVPDLSRPRRLRRIAGPREHLRDARDLVVGLAQRGAIVLGRGGQRRIHRHRAAAAFLGVEPRGRHERADRRRAVARRRVAHERAAVRAEVRQRQPRADVRGLHVQARQHADESPVRIPRRHESAGAPRIRRLLQES